MRFIKALVVLVTWVPWLVSAEEALEAENMPEKVSLKVSVKGGAFNAKFKFFDASVGGLGYVDLPGAKHYLGASLLPMLGARNRLQLATRFMYLCSDPRIHLV